MVDFLYIWQTCKNKNIFLVYFSSVHQNKNNTNMVHTTIPYVFCQILFIFCQSRMPSHTYIMAKFALHTRVHMTAGPHTDTDKHTIFLKKPHCVHGCLQIELQKYKCIQKTNTEVFPHKHTLHYSSNTDIHLPLYVT